jgi:hypothetical protein
MAGQGSARVTLREIDKSQVKNPQQLPQGVPAAVVGPARKGPAFVPRTFANIQQFNEVFGNMSEVGREGNSNLFGPLAINEWMKSAQAGTYIRVLGVGDGKAATGGKVTDAGFVVGAKQLQDQSSGVAKVDNNPHANINNATNALALGRTHFLGCFMKDASGSTYLQDSGVQTATANAYMKIVLEEQPVANDTITFTYLNDNNDTEKTHLFTFVGGAPNANEIQISGNLQATANNIVAELADVVGTGGAIMLTGTRSSSDDTDTDLSQTIQIDQAKAGSGVLGNLPVLYDFNPASGDTSKITVGGKRSSVTSQTISWGIEEDAPGKCEIRGTENSLPLDTSFITLNSLVLDGAGGAVVSVDNDVKYIFKEALGDDGVLNPAAPTVADTFSAIAATVVHVQIAANVVDTLDNLKSAILHVNDSANQPHDNEGAFTVSTSLDGLTLTVTHTLGGLAGHTIVTLSNTEDGDAATRLTVKAGVDQTATYTAKILVGDSGAAVDATGFMFGASNGSATSLTIGLTAQPNEDDEFTLIACTDDADTTTLVSEEFIFKAAGNNGATEAGTKILVRIGPTVQETLINLKRVLNHDDDTSNSALDAETTATSDDNADTVTIRQEHFGGGLGTKYTNTFSVSEAFVITNSDGDRVVGSHGEKTASFAGGGGGAAPVIRGVLMTPQGVRPALDVNTGLTQFLNYSSTTNDKQATESNVRSSADNRADFGNTAGSNLVGYIVGEVTSGQSFKLILNGYGNTENPEALSCSFDPSSPSYFAKVLNTDPTKIEELGHYLYANWDIESLVAEPSNAGLVHAGSQVGAEFENMKGFLVAGEGDGVAKRNSSAAGKPNYEDFSERFATAKTPWIVSQFYGVGANDAVRANSASASLGDAKKLFRLHALDDGEVGNSQFRLLISNLRYNGLNDYGTFDLTLESFDSDPILGNALVSWKNADLDPNSRNFIGRLIGDKHIYYDFDRDVSKQRLKEAGKYSIKNSFVRIELSDDLKQGQIPTNALPAGFQGHSHLKTSSTGNFLELDVAETNRIFTNTSNQVTETLSQAQIAPLDYVTSINRNVGGSAEADDNLAWGIKFAVRENSSSSNKELSEQVFNKSISSWAKFFPSDETNPAWITDGDTADSNQNSFFSLEKIAIPSLTTSDPIATWDGAVYKRNHADAPADGRFVTISQDATGGNSKYLKFRCMFQGGFDGTNIFDEQKSEFSGVASLREGEDEAGSQKYTGPTIMAYQRAIDVLSDKSSAEFQLLAIPGQRTPRITDYAINACETRFDSLFIMDVVEKDGLDSLIESADTKPHVRNTITLFSNRVLDTSFAAAYFPDVVIRRPSDNAPIVVPPSVGMLGVMSRNDSIADPWFAPAGLNRGKIGAISSRVQMNRDLLNELYDADINPIYVPAGREGEVYAFGQKTLLQDASALDRINVRRLLIDIRRKVKKVGEKLLFEPNRASTLARFSSLVEPIMANVQQRRGVTRYKVQIDSSTTTQNDIENNTIRGKVYLQPTKSVEFISLDFVVANTIQ